MKSGAVTTLIMLGGNPVYDSPADIDFVGALKAVPNSIHLTLYDNETTQLCKWAVPQAHYLESWSDARAWDGTVSVVQPLIEPLYDGKTPATIAPVFIPGQARKKQPTVRAVRVTQKSDQMSDIRMSNCARVTFSKNKILRMDSLLNGCGAQPKMRPPRQTCSLQFPCRSDVVRDV